ncbi:MAG: hypothetical protein KDC80_29170 [Saprospiraceae bacterium]|nr:hypothetical protein [Saprospiraceae bacterium]
MRSQPTIRYIFLLGCFFYCIHCQTPGRSEEVLQRDDPGFFGSIFSEKMLDFDLTFDWDSLTGHLESEEKVPAILHIGDYIFDSIEISGRGVTRKKICEFPPLHLNFSSKIRDKYHWGKYKKYKLVTHCNAENDPGDLVLREFLVYRLYNILTPFSLRVQLCQVMYKTGRPEIKHYAFIIEDDDEMADRLQSEILKEKDGAVKQIDKREYQKLVMFQYMIGNTDWNLSQRHNIKFLTRADNLFAIPVPYDFDYSGIVNAPYATPYPSLPIKNVRERLWQYRGREDDDFSEIEQIFRDNKTAFISQIDSLDALSEEMRKEMINYLLSFYEELEARDLHSKN